MEITIPFIIKTIENYFNLPEGSIQIKTRKREVVQARQIAMFFSKNLTKSSLASIGSQIGHKDHATVLHACKTVNNLIDTDKQFSNDCDEICKQLKTEPYITKEEIFEAINQALIQRFVEVVQWKNKIKSLL
ncbi:MAG: helix-turn-helix domain-containing protein [Lutibacter sp.]|jgi:chromosomal replication initiator protein